MKKEILNAFVGASIGALFPVHSAHAVDFETENLQGSFNTTIGVGAGMRLQNPSCSITGDTNICGSSANTAQWSGGDDGNLNYRKGDFFTTYIKGTHELLIKAPEGLKFFARGTWKKDFTADNTRRTDLSEDTKDQIVTNAELLDFWVSKDLSIADQSVRVRLGNQVISWGEALFFIGGVSNNVLDFQKLLVPGTQLKEAFLPVPAISVTSTLGNGVSAEAYYQFKWRRNRVAPSGSYFSAADYYGKGKVPIAFSSANFNETGRDQYSLTGARQLSEGAALAAITANGDFAVPILPERKAKNDGQFGVSTRWAPEGSNVNFGAYAVNYHDQFPVLSLVNGGSAYEWSFAQNRQMYGATANFPVGNWAVGTELSYRPRDAVTLSGCFAPGGPLDANTNAVAGDCPLYKDNKKYQFSVTGMLQLQKSENPFLLGLLAADSAFLTLEGAISYYPGLSKPIVRTINGNQVVQVAAAGYFAGLDSSGGSAIATRVGTAASMGYVADFNWTYDGKLISGWQVTPGVTFSHAVKGDTPNYAAQFLEGNKSANFYVLFNQNPVKWQAGINYTTYFGGKKSAVERQYFKDRDFIGVFAAYTF